VGDREPRAGVAETLADAEAEVERLDEIGPRDQEELTGGAEDAAAKLEGAARGGHEDQAVATARSADERPRSAASGTIRRTTPGTQLSSTGSVPAWSPSICTGTFG